MARKAVMLLLAVAVGASGCGGGDSESDRARKAAETYVHDLGVGDGEAVCADGSYAGSEASRDHTATSARGRDALT